MQERTAGILACIGGFLWQFLLGASFIWGNIAPYVTSYLRQADESITSNCTFYVYAIQVMTGGFLMYLGTSIALKCHPKISMSIALLLGCGGIFLSSIVTNYYLFLLTYGVCFGLAYALSSTISLIVAWSCFLRLLRARVSAVISAGFGLSIVGFIVLTLKLANPDNVFPDIEIEEDSIRYHYYSEAIANNSPIMLRYGALITACLGVVAIALTPNFRAAISSSCPEPGNPEGLGEIFRERSIYMIMISVFFVSPPAMYFLSAYKTYGMNVGGHDDEFLTFVGCLAIFLNVPFRKLWEIVLGKLGFKKSVSILFIIQIPLIVLVDYIAHIRVVYCIFICLIISCQGAAMTLFPGVAGQLYGPAWGGKIISILVAMVGLSGIVAGVLQQTLVTQIGYFGLFLIFGGFQLLGLLLILIGYSDKNKWLEWKRKSAMAMQMAPLLPKEQSEKAD